jgi:hypothetical protein
MDVQEYPKWVETPDGRKVIVPDAQTEAAVVKGHDVIPTFPVGESTTHHPIVPSVGPVEKVAPVKKRKEK